MLTSLKPLLEPAIKYNFAYGAFNVNSVAQVEGAIRMHEIFRSPSLLQGAELANAFMGGRTDFMNGTLEEKKAGMKNLVEAVRRYGEDSPVPVVLHLDHGQTFESCQAAIDAGYTSVMIDGSSKPFEENMELTREVVKYAHARGVSVEGELGVLAGEEDHVFSENSTYTHPLDAVRFVKATEVDALAISYGTSHGVVKGKNVKLRKEIAIAVNECLAHERLFCGLVSHGSSNVPAEVVAEINALGGQIGESHGIPIPQLKEVIQIGGIRKINVDTDIRLATTRNIRELFRRRPELLAVAELAEIHALLQEKPAVFDPRAYLTPVMDMVMSGRVPGAEMQSLAEAIKDAVMEVTGKMIVEFGSYHMAPLVKVRKLAELKAEYEAAR